MRPHVDAPVIVGPRQGSVAHLGLYAVIGDGSTTLLLPNLLEESDALFYLGFVQANSPQIPPLNVT